MHSSRLHKIRCNVSNENPWIELTKVTATGVMVIIAHYDNRGPAYFHVAE